MTGSNWYAAAESSWACLVSRAPVAVLQSLTAAVPSALTNSSYRDWEEKSWPRKK